MDEGAALSRWQLSRRLTFGIGALIPLAVLFVLYARLSQTDPIDSDVAGFQLAGQAMARGNVLLHGWALTNVSFLTTDLPFNALAVALDGLTPASAHYAGACIYSLVLLCAVLLARGDSCGRGAYIRMLTTMVLLLAPAPGLGVRLLLLGPDHVGTTLLLLLALIVLDRVRERRYGPVAFGALLGLAAIADPLALYVGTAATVVVGVLGLLGPDRAGWRSVVALLAGAALSVLVPIVAIQLIQHFGGFFVSPLDASFAPLADVARHFGLALEGTLVLFGADFFGQPLTVNALPTLLHLAGYGFAAFVLWKAIVAWGRGAERDRVNQMLAALVLLDLVAYVFSNQALDLGGTRYLTPSFVFSAVLAGRLGADRILERRLLVPVLIVGLTYVAAFAAELRTTPPPDQAASLGTWLDGHHLRYGLGSYWDASVVTVDTGGRVRVRAIELEGHGLGPYLWASDHTWYDASLPGNDARFLVFEPGRHDTVNARSAMATFGSPTSIHQVGQYTVMVWDKNLLQDLRSSDDVGSSASRT